MVLYHRRSIETLDEMLTGAAVSTLVSQELARFQNVDLLASVRAALVTPYVQNRPWNYGSPGTTYPCWIVVDPPSLDVGIAYCELGFGPRMPWGLLFLANGGSDIGADSGWFASLEDAAHDLFGSIPSN